MAPSNPLGKPDKLDSSLDKLTKSMESLAKATQTTSTIIGGTAFLSAFKTLSAQIPKATNALIGQLSKSVTTLNKTMHDGIGLMRTAFRSLYLAITQVVTNLNALFATASVHKAATSRGMPSSRGFLQQLTGGILGSKTPGNLAIGTGTGQLAPMAGISQGIQEIKDNLKDLKASNIEASRQSSLYLRAGLDEIYNIVANQTISAIVNGANHVFTGLKAILVTIRDSEELININLESLLQRLDVSINQTKVSIETLTAMVVDAAAGIIDLLERAVSSHSLYVHVKDDPTSRAGLTKAKSQGGGFGLGSILKGIGIFSGLMTVFGGALNPGAVLQLGLAFRDLAATVGVAFEPAIHIVTRTLRQVGAIVLPLFVQLRPAITQVVDAFVRAFLPMVRLAADRFELLVTPIQLVASIIDGLSSVFETLATIALTFQQTITDFILSFVNVDAKGMMKSIVSSLQYVGQQLVLAVAYIAKKLGANSFVDKLVKNFEALTKPAPMGGAVAGGNTSLTSLENVVKQMAVNAGQAGGFAGPSPEEEAKEREAERLRIAQETLDSLKEIQKKGDTDTLLPQIRALCEDVVKGIKTADEILGWIKSFFEALPRGIKDAKEGFNQGYTAGKNKSGRPATHSIVGELFADMGMEFGGF